MVAVAVEAGGAAAAADADATDIGPRVQPPRARPRFAARSLVLSAIITVQEVAKSFGPRQVLAGVSLAVHQRDRIAIVGVNGAGKSTLLRLIVGPAGAGDGAAQPEAATADMPDRGLITRRRDLTLE